MQRALRVASVGLAVLMLQGSLSPALAQKVPTHGADPSPPAGAKPIAREASPAVALEELQPAADDPPTLVGRVARSSGSTSLRLPGSEDWQPAGLNTTLTAGTALWTEPGARLAIEAGQSRLFLEGGTAMQLDELNDDGLRATLAQGSAFLRAQGMEANAIEIITPEGRFETTVDGRYLIEAAAPDGSQPARISVFEGAARFQPTAGEPVRLRPGQAIALSGPQPEIIAIGPQTPLMAWALGAEPRRPIPAAARGMTGIAELSSYGQWGRNAEYGDVWYPPVQESWAPYTDGSWQWREPWGWVWVDAAPWGFAPSHYGRWVRVGPRWGWAPQPVRVYGPPVRPAWAPALVAFFGGYALGAASRPVGWVPLAPREPYYPWYRASPRYVQRINYRQVTNVVNVRNVWVERGGRDLRWDDEGRRDVRFHDRRLEEFRHRRDAVQVPERVMRESAPVRPEVRRVRYEDARRADLAGGLPLRRDAATRGVTERSAERLGLPPEQLRRADRDRAPAPPPPVRAALADPRRDEARPPRPREEAARPPREELRRESIEDARRPREAAPRPDRDDARRQQADPALRQQQENARRQQIEEMRRQQRDDARRQQDEAGRQQQDQARRQQREELRRQQREDAGRRQQDQMRRQQDDARRQQQDQVRRQQDEGARRQQENAQRQQEQAQRQQEQARRQQDQAQRQQMQMEQARRQQENAQRQQEQAQRQQEQARRQQDQAQRQQMQMEQAQRQQMQMEQARRQQENAQRQQELAQRQQEQARRQQEQAQRQQMQMEQARRQQENAQRQQELAQRHQEQARRQQEQARRQQEAEARRQR